MMINSD